MAASLRFGAGVGAGGRTGGGVARGHAVIGSDPTSLSGAAPQDPLKLAKGSPLSFRGFPSLIWVETVSFNCLQGLCLPFLSVSKWALSRAPALVCIAPCSS